MATTKKEVLSILNQYDAVHQSVIRLSSISLDIQGFWDEFNFVLTSVCNIIEAENGFFASIEKELNDGTTKVMIQSIAKPSLPSLQQGTYLSFGSEFQKILKQGSLVVMKLSEKLFSEEIASEIKNHFSVESFVLVPMKIYGCMIFFCDR